MRRLVYAPKAYVFVRSNTQGGRVYNLSPDVVSGQIERNVNDLSTASVVIRNRFRKWIKDPSNNMSILMPMDMITIWLQRISGKPIQVFTGYLNSVPYYQMYPGNTQITASCTLKRIAYSWFDPGLEWFQNWFSSAGGWSIVNPETGDVLNTNALATTAAGNKMKINDGGFAELIQRFMVDIAGWSPDMVVVSDLPANLPKVAAALYAKIQKQNDVTQDALEEMLSNIMGVSATPISSQTQDAQSATQQSAVGSVKKVASDKNIPLVIPLTAALLATGFRPAYAKNQDRARTEDDWGYGLYAMKPTVSTVNDRRTRGGTIVKEGDTIGGVDKSRIGSAEIATRVFLTRMQQVNTPTSEINVQHGHGPYDAALKGDQSTTLAWIEKALNRQFASDDFTGAYIQAKSMIAAFAHPKAAQTQGVHGVPTPTDVTWASLSAGGGQSGSLMDSLDYKVWGTSYRKAYDSLAPYYWMAKSHYSGIHLQNPGKQMTNTLVLGGTTSALEGFFNAVKNHTEYSSITFARSGGGRNQITTWRDGHASTASTEPNPGGVGQSGSTVTLVVAQNAQYPAWTFAKDKPLATSANSGSDVTGGGLNTASKGQMTIEQVGTVGYEAAFLSQFSFNANFTESLLLTGYKALANDTSCMDGMKQFCQSSMRSFMSLPDGRFCAFYPDYFGAHGRKPYWYMYDIEITNGGIMLSDEQLATHVYTIGDTIPGNEEITFLDYIRSAGVVTIDMGVLDGFIRPLQNQAAETKSVGGDRALGALKTAADFLYHYGARPYVEEIPMVRNQYFEFLYAWQRFMQKWAATFQTTIEFTFQPEIMCGGIIGFPQHNLQMYCEQVTHTWDYTAGFQTTATLSSPAAMSSTASGDIGSLPGFALAGNVNSVGTPAGQ